MASPVKSAQGSVAARAGKNTLRERAAKQRRQQNQLLIGIAAVFVLLIAFVIYLNVRGQQPVAGEETFATLGNTHIQFGSPSPIEYNSVPPTSGPHYDNIVAWNIYKEPQRYEHLVHNLEDAGVIIYYQCEDGCPETVQKLSAVAQPYIDAGRHVLVVPNDPKWTVGGSEPLHKDMGAKIALAAWQHILKLNEVDEGKMRTFIERYEGIDHHQGAGG